MYNDCVKEDQVISCKWSKRQLLTRAKPDRQAVNTAQTLCSDSQSGNNVDVADCNFLDELSILGEDLHTRAFTAAVTDHVLARRADHRDLPRVPQLTLLAPYSSTGILFISKANAHETQRSASSQRRQIYNCWCQYETETAITAHNLNVSKDTPTNSLKIHRRHVITSNSNKQY